MKSFCEYWVTVWFIVLSLVAHAENPAQATTLQGIIHQQHGNVKSLSTWNAPGDPYYLLQLSEGGGQQAGHELNLRPSRQVSAGKLQTFIGQAVILKGYYTAGQRPETPLASTLEQVPIEPKFEANSEGKMVNSGWQTMKRGQGFVVLDIAKAPVLNITLPGAVIDYEWAHESGRLALLVEVQAGQNLMIIVDAEGKAPVMRIPIPGAYRPHCFAWLADDSGFLLAMATADKTDEFIEDNFYRYTFAEQQFEPVYQLIERQFAHVFSIAVDHGSKFWAAASVGEGHPDLAIYQDEATVLLTDVFPGSIAPLFWQDHRLWCVTEARLELGFTREERARHQHFDAQKYPERDWGDVAAYRIDPVLRQASLERSDMAVLEAALSTSYDHRYHSALAGDAGLFTLTISVQKGVQP